MEATVASVRAQFDRGVPPEDVRLAQGIKKCGRLSRR
jgi:hypothetical protein